MSTSTLLAMVLVATASCAAAHATTVAPAPAEEAPAASPLASLTDAECLALARYVQQAERLIADTWVRYWDNSYERRMLKAADKLRKLPMEGMPEDFRCFLEEGFALFSGAMPGILDVQSDLPDSGTGPEHRRVQQELDKLRAQFYERALALETKYPRAAIFGIRNLMQRHDRYTSELHLRQGRARAFLDAHPEVEAPEVLPSARLECFQRYLAQLPLPELTAHQARLRLKRMEAHRLLDPDGELQDNIYHIKYRVGDRFVVRLPHVASTGGRWQLGTELPEDAAVSVSWRLEPQDATPTQALATVEFRKAEKNVVLPFICVNPQDEVPLARKTYTFDIKPQTDPPRPEPQLIPDVPKQEPGVNTLTDDEVRDIDHQLQRCYRDTMWKAARAAAWGGEPSLTALSACALPDSFFRKLPPDFHNYMVEVHTRLTPLEEKLRENEHQQQEISNSAEQHAALQQEQAALEAERDKLEQALQEKYPRACILDYARPKDIVARERENFRKEEGAAKDYYERYPEMREVSRNEALNYYFRYLSDLSTHWPYNLARQRVERLDALRLMKVMPGKPLRYYLTPSDRAEVMSILLPCASATGCSWKLDRVLPADAPVQVEWTPLPAARLRQLKDRDVIVDELPDSDEVMVASIRKATNVSLRFVCTRPGEREPLLRASAEIAVGELMPGDLRETSTTPPQPECVPSFTDEEALAIETWLHRIRPALLLGMADKLEQDKLVTPAHMADIISAQPMEELPDDVRAYIKKLCALTCATEQQLNNTQAIDPFMAQSVEKYRALDKQYPRAGFLITHPSLNGWVAFEDLRCGLGKAAAFLAAHPEMDREDNATKVAWLRHLAAEPQPEPTLDSAQATLARLALLNRLQDAGNGSITSFSMRMGEVDSQLLPDDRRSGYAWQLATPLPPDSPVQVEWHHLPTAELQALRALGLRFSRRLMPNSPDITIATFRARQAGKVRLNLIYTRPGEEEPLLRQEFHVDVVEK